MRENPRNPKKQRKKKGRKEGRKKEGEEQRNGGESCPIDIDWGLPFARILKV